MGENKTKIIRTLVELVRTLMSDVPIPPLHDGSPQNGATPTPVTVWTPHRELYEKHATQAWTDQQASSDSFDNNLLTFSSSALGLSLAFIKDIVPLKDAHWLIWLYSSWIFFAACIVTTIASFQFGIQAQKVHLDHLYKYYLEGKKEYFQKKSCWSKAITWCAIIGSIMFFAGLVATITFACKNISQIQETHKVPSKNNNSDSNQQKTLSGTANDARSVIPMTPLIEARSPITMTPVPQHIQKARAPINMTPVQAQAQVATPAVVPAALPPQSDKK
jgi:hypothetical protein